MPYLEARPTGPASRYVQAFWQASGAFGPGETQRVLPDACSDFIFDLTNATRRTSDCATMVGTMTRAIVVPRTRGLFGIRFRPGAAWLLYRAPMKALCDMTVALGDVVETRRSFAEQLASPGSVAQRIALAEAFIEERMRAAEIDDEKRRTIEHINTHLEAGAAGTALAGLGWNERKLQRFFEAAYGTSPATMRCFWRFEHLRRRLLRDDSADLAELALDHGYSDQAHMAREFQRFAGLSITAWRAETALAA
jgi:AraC-like DNA-binding protein